MRLVNVGGTDCHMGGTAKIDRGATPWRWLAMVACLALLVTGQLTATSAAAASQGDQAWADTGTPASSPCGGDTTPIGYPCCAGGAGCLDAAVPGGAVGSVAGRSPQLVWWRQEQAVGQAAAPLFHPPRLSSLI